MKRRFDPSALLRGSTEEDAAFFAEIGRAITAWSSIESKLFRICQTVLQTDRELTAVVFFRTPTLKARVELTEELLKAEFKKERADGGKDHPMIAKWHDLRGKINRLSNTRNILAHHQVSWTGANGEPTRIEIAYKVNEGWRGKGTTDTRLHVEDIIEHVGHLSEVLRDASAYMVEILALLPEPPVRRASRQSRG